MNSSPTAIWEPHFIVNSDALNPFNIRHPALLWLPKARTLYFTAVIFFQFVSIDERPAMGSQPNLACRSKVMSIYQCPPKRIGRDLPQIWGAKNIEFWAIFYVNSALDTAYLRNETSHRQIKMLVSIYNVSPKGLPTFRDLWPRNGWDLFVYCDPPFGGHYVATINVGCDMSSWSRIYHVYSVESATDLPDAITWPQMSNKNLSSFTHDVAGALNPLRRCLRRPSGLRHATEPRRRTNRDTQRYRQWRTQRWRNIRVKSRGARAGLKSA